MPDIDPTIDYENLFKCFWHAGMRKMNKKKAKALFMKIIKAQPNPEEFVTMLVEDIIYRLENKQRGFDAMHPTTYLNGERWDDEKPKLNMDSIDNFIDRQSDRSWAEDLH